MCPFLAAALSERRCVLEYGWTLLFVEFQCPWVTAQCRYLDFHEGIKRERVQDFVKFGGTFDVENADVSEFARHAPEMQPLPLFLEYLGALVFLSAKYFELLCIHVAWDADIHQHVKQHL
jgi:hypothetical protein